MLTMKGPLLIACNHPNSFLDAIILATLFDKPIISLARGDAFKNKFIFKLLRSLNILPVYRLSEGAENLNTNYKTFDQCREIFRNNGIVLIFSEGLCVNEWKLRPLKKGTARLAISCWADGIGLKVLPTGINYNSFHEYGKIVRLHFGNMIDKKTLIDYDLNGNNINHFNRALQNELSKLVDEFHSEDKESIRNRYEVPSAKKSYAVFIIPAFIGKWIHAPLYKPLQIISQKKAGAFGHYDSVLIGLLFILYPFYLGLISVCIYLYTNNWYWIIPWILLPILAWTFVQSKNAKLKA